MLLRVYLRHSRTICKLQPSISGYQHLGYISIWPQQQPFSSGNRLFHRTRASNQQPDDRHGETLVQRFKSSLHFPQETHSLTASNAFSPATLGETVVLHGYLGSSASLSKKLFFVQLISKDRIRSIQLISSSNPLPGKDPLAQEHVRRLPMHTPVAVTGIIRERKQQPDQSSSDVHKILHVEVDLLNVQPLNEFPSDIIATPDTVFGPDQRHLQLRGDVRLKSALAERSAIGFFLRSKLHDLGFVEVETPLLFKSTPEGAREFIVPTRRKGFAYALPQSPQQYKQILMSSGIIKYFQFARCFRDEDLRADRQPEFTQLDLEMSFSGAAEVMRVIEDLVHSLWSQFCKDQLAGSFPKFSYAEAMSRYGSDKPDIRIKPQISRVDFLLPGDLISKITPLQGPVVDAFILRFDSRTDRDTQKTRNFITKFLESPEGMPFVLNPEGAPGVFIVDSRKPLQGLQALGFEAAERIEDLYDIEDGDLLILQARPNRAFSGGSTALGNLRLALHAAAVREGFLEPLKGFAPLWVTDFPLFSPISDTEPGQGGSAGLAATHHPFTSPKTAEDVDMLLRDPTKVIGDHYDLVINGVELGGGSRRIHSADMQAFIMRDILKMNPTRLADFSHLLEVLRAGCPPHAGIALGFDRLIAMILNKSSVREVIAFPKSGKGEDMLVKSPGPLSDEILETYSLQYRS